ncbi:MAG TPA: dUTP diphosphatase [Bacteroidota bacterium]|nr:dUTP diphosphatase [Bacteroidota bacterium]
MSKTKKIKIRVSRVDSNFNDIPLPSYATDGSSGMDIHAAVNGEIIVKPGETILVPTGFSIEIPSGYEAQVRPRSGLAIKHNIGILNSPGTIDSDYRGELKIILTNFGKKKFVVRRGDRIAQLVVAPVVRAVWEEVFFVNTTSRGSGGFGHTGTATGKSMKRRNPKR